MISLGTINYRIEPVTFKELLRHLNLIREECQAGEIIEQDRQNTQLNVEALVKKLTGTI
jgi:hypothetical protein